MPLINMGMSLNPYGPPMQGPPDPNLAQDPQVPPPDADANRGPFSAPGGPRAGNEATDSPAPPPSFAGAGYDTQSIEPAITLPPQPESGNTGNPRPGSTEAIQTPTLIPPRRDFMSVVGRALLSSPHALGRALGGILAGGALNDQQQNQQAMEDFKNQSQASSLQELIKQRHSIEQWREAQANNLNAKAGQDPGAGNPRVQMAAEIKALGPNPDPDDVKAIQTKYGYAPKEAPVAAPVQSEQWIADKLAHGTPEEKRVAQALLAKQTNIKEPVDSFEKEEYAEWAADQKAKGLPSDRMTFKKAQAQTTAKATATNAKASNDIADLDNNIDLASTLRTEANKVLLKHPNAIGGKITGLVERAKYGAGFAPGEDYQTLIPAAEALKAYATGPLLHGIRNQMVIKQIWQHIPNATDAPDLLVKKADFMENLMRNLRKERAGAAGIDQRDDDPSLPSVPGLDQPPVRSKPSGGAPAAPPSAGGFSQTATNPKTGEKVGWNGTQWVPIPK